MSRNTQQIASLQGSVDAAAAGNAKAHKLARALLNNEGKHLLVGCADMERAYGLARELAEDFDAVTLVTTHEKLEETLGKFDIAVIVAEPQLLNGTSDRASAKIVSLDGTDSKAVELVRAVSR